MIALRVLLPLTVSFFFVFSQVHAASPIQVERLGNADGRTLLLLPGLASSTDVWQGTVDALQADYDIRLVQLAGFAGLAAQPADGSRVEQVVAALSAYLQSEPGNRTLVMGHSLGGFLSLTLAIDSPSLVDEIIIVDSLPFLAALFIPGATPEQAAEMGPNMTAQIKAMSRSDFDAQQRGTLVRLTNTSDFLPTLVRWSAESDLAVVADFTGELMAADLRPRLPRITQKTTILVPWDAAVGIPEDQFVGLYEQQYSSLPDSRIQKIDGAYHFLMIDQPQAYLNAVLDVLQ